jgi:transcriptional regulator with XRE-family HTH domain
MLFCLGAGGWARECAAMTLGEKLKTIRRECGLSQEAFGAQGFVSTPGWIKLENSQRSPSEKLIESLITWLVTDKYVRASAAKGLKEELLTLKYLSSNSPFVREMARTHAKGLAQADELLAPSSPSEKPKRGRPKRTAVR